MPGTDKTFTDAHSEYVDVEREVLQHSILLYDAKSGILMGFSGLLITRCLDKLSEFHTGAALFSLTALSQLLYILAIACFSVTILYAWQVIRPRVTQANDLVYWGSDAFMKSGHHYLETILSAGEERLRKDILQLLYVLARICQMKTRNFWRATLSAEVSTVVIALAEIARIASHMGEAAQP